MTVDTLPLTDDTELSILEQIYSSQKNEGAITQRALAQASGLSLGMTNVLLKRFSDKGWVILKRVNSRNIHYALSPEGVQEIAHRTYRYFKRTARNASLYRDILEAFVMKKRHEGINRVILAGVSDLDFILEYACERHGVVFAKSADHERAARMAGDSGTLVVWTEDRRDSCGDAICLGDVVAGVR